MNVRPLVVSLFFTFSLASCVNTSEAAIVNPSFEADGAFVNFYDGPPMGWSLEGVDNFATDQFGGSVGPAGLHLVTEGTFGARLFSRTGADTSGNPLPRTFLAGERIRLYQQLDLTGVNSILFDAQLVNTVSLWIDLFEAQVRVNDDLLWSRSTVDTYLDQTLDTSGRTGIQTLEFRLEVVSEGVVSGLLSNWFQIDNLRLEVIPEPHSSMLLLGSMAACAFATRPKSRRSP